MAIDSSSLNISAYIPSRSPDARGMCEEQPDWLFNDSSLLQRNDSSLSDQHGANQANQKPEG